MTLRLPAGWAPTTPVIDLDDPARPRVVPPADRRVVRPVIVIVQARRFTP